MPLCLLVCDIVVLHISHSNKYLSIDNKYTPPLHPPYTHIAQTPQPTFIFFLLGEHMPTESQLRHIGITGEQLATTDQSTV